MQAKKDTQKKLLFKFVDEESDDYFKRSDEKELQLEGGDDDKNKKMAMIVAGVVIVGLLVGFFALRKGDDTEAAATYTSALAAPDSAPDADGNCANGAAPADGAACTLEEQGYTVDGDDITDSAAATESKA